MKSQFYCKRHQNITKNAYFYNRIVFHCIRKRSLCVPVIRFFLWDPFVFRSLQFEWIVIWMVRAINRISPFSIWFKDFPPRIQNGTTTVLREAVYSCCMPEAHRNRKHSSKWPFDLFSVGYVRASNQNPTIMEFWLARCDYEFENRPLLSGRENANDALA